MSSAEMSPDNMVTGTADNRLSADESVKLLGEEWLLTPNPQRFVLFPIRHHDIWSMYKQHVASFWTAEEVDLGKDMDDWRKLSSDEKHFIKNVLAFFAASDGIVLENVSVNFLEEVQIPEAQCFYGFQIMMENIHSEVYSLLIDTYVQDQTEKMHLLDAIHTIDSVQCKANWAQKWMHRDKPFAQRLVAFAAVEGIFFSGSFCAIFWLKKRGLMNGLCYSNEMISRDEGLHTRFACMLYGKLEHHLEQQDVHAIIREALEYEKHFICEALPCDLIGMNKDLMGQYIKFMANHLLRSLGYEPLSSVENPFEWMDLISLGGKTNFFERRVGEYQRAGVMEAASQTLTRVFTTHDEF
eukprot:837068-Rhodomonas_salina.2